jgi:hypothetical protein
VGSYGGVISNDHDEQDDTNGRVAMDSDERVICSKWFDRRDMIAKVELKVS